ncbi:eukaryotic translation initiation factor 3 subunit D [Pelagophyceae sp. CCMP2097]|nr:eukaryotic translation initiation factor 3 subunit D [Pelagophyceae sp. CCMP2097]
MAAMANTEEGASAPFQVPVINQNLGGWGPMSDNLPAQFVDMPYAPFGKGDRLGRAADFSTSAHAHFAAKQKYRRKDEGGELKNDDFQYKYDAVEDSSFHLVDTAKAKTSRFSMGFKKPWQRGGRGGKGGWGGKGGPGARSDPKEQTAARGKGGRPMQASRGKGGWGGRGGGRFGNRRNNQQRPDRASTVKVGADWKVIEEFDLAQLTKLSTKAPEAVDLMWAGELATYDEAYERCSTRAEKKLQRMENVEFYYVSTTDDPAIEKLAAESAGNVYGTDAIMSLLMASPRSVYPWDIIVQKVDGTIIFDKRDTAAFDYLSVSETSHEPPVVVDEADEAFDKAINTPDKLSLEATMINQNFSQQILKPDTAEQPREKFALPNPFADASDSTSKPASIAYRYRMFELAEYKIVLRTELHATVIKRAGDAQRMTCYALNEWDSRLSGGVDWRMKIDQQRGAVLATELKNNSCKLARWTAQSILAGADQMKLGYVSRTAKTNPYEHTILATQFYKPREFATQITLNVNNMWGIVKMLLDMLMAHPDGKYVIVRDANKPIVRIYSVPASTFESDEDEDEDENQKDQGNQSSDEEY